MLPLTPGVLHYPVQQAQALDMHPERLFLFGDRATSSIL